MTRFVRAEEIARELGVSRTRAYEIMHEIPHVVSGRSVRVEREVLDSYMRCGRIEVVYFASSGTSGPIKIGRAFDLKERMMRLQIGNPEPIILLGYVYGGLDRERQLHERFERHHLRGEWFLRATSLLEFIETNARKP